MLKNLWKRIVILIILGTGLIFLFNSTWFIKLFYPYPYRELIKESCLEYKADPCLVLAIIRTESSFYPRAKSEMGARGLMQIMPETGAWIAAQMKIDNFNQEMLSKPEYNIPMGIWYLSYLDKSFAGHLPKMLAAYNAGEGKVRKWLDDRTWSGKQQDLHEIPYAETREYVDSVLFDYQVYKRLYKNELFQKKSLNWDAVNNKLRKNILLLLQTGG